MYHCADIIFTISLTLVAFIRIVEGAPCLSNVSLRNTAVLLGSTATFTCDATLDSQLGWEFTSIGDAARSIMFSRGERLDKPFRYDPPKYIVSGSNDGTRTLLTIKDVNAQKAGSYKCLRCNQTSQLRAHLIVLESDPICNTTEYSSNGSASDSISMFCIVVYSGNLVPVMQWTRGNDVIDEVPSYTHNKSSASVRLTSNLTLSRSDILDGGEIVCTTLFRLNGQAGVGEAGNAPDYTYTWLVPFSRSSKSTNARNELTTQRAQSTSGLSDAATVTRRLTTPSIFTYQSSYFQSTEPAAATIPTLKRVDITPAQTGLAPSSPDTVVIAMSCAFVGLVIIFINVVIGIFVYHKKSDANVHRSGAEPIVATETEYAALTIKWNPGSKGVTTPTEALIELEPDCVQVPQYNESALYDDLVSVKSSESSEYNYPDQETIQFMNEVGRRKREACLPTKLFDTDSTKSESNDYETALKYTAEPFANVSGSRGRVDQGIMQPRDVVEHEVRSPSVEAIQSSDWSSINTFRLTREANNVYELPMNEKIVTNVFEVNEYAVIQDDEPEDYQYVLASTETKYIELVH